MRKYFLLFCLLVSANVFAQKERRVTPSYFMSGELTSADSFNRFLMVAIPQFKLESVDSSKTKWDFNFVQGKNNMLKITYYIEKVTKINTAGVNAKRTLSHVELHGNYETLAKLYCHIFKDTASVEALKKQLPIRGPVYYGFNDYVWNSHSYWFTFADVEQDGYCMLFR